MRNLPKFTFRTADGVEYEIIWKCPAKSMNASGLCDPSDCKNPKIWVDPKLKEKRLLEVIIEEVTHAFWFDKTEREARKFAAVLKKLIYKSGWRLGG